MPHAWSSKDGRGPSRSNNPRKLAAITTAAMAAAISGSRLPRSTLRSTTQESGPAEPVAEDDQAQQEHDAHRSDQDTARVVGVEELQDHRGEHPSQVVGDVVQREGPTPEI